MVPSDSFNLATLRRKRLPPSSMALTQSLQALTLFSDDFSGHIVKLATLIAAIISLSSWFLSRPDTLEVSRTSSVKNLVTKLRKKFGHETLSAKHSDRNTWLNTSVMGYTLLSFTFLFCFLSGP